MADTDITHEIIIRGIKLVDLGFITVLYFFAGLINGRVIDNILGPFNIEEENKKTTTRIVFEAIGLLWLNAIIIYITRNLMPLIPFPLEGVNGYKHGRVKELISATTFIYAFLYFQEHFQSKMRNLYKRFASN
jgi:hypothetical protein